MSADRTRAPVRSLAVALEGGPAGAIVSSVNGTCSWMQGVANARPQVPVATGYGAWTGQRLPDGGYSALAIYLSSRQAPRTAAEFRNELQAMARVNGLE
jgi:hypothetical protein